MKTSRIGRWGTVVVLAITFLASRAALAPGVCLAAADEQAELRQKALSLNDITGDDPIEAQVKELVADPAGTKKLLVVAVKMAKEKEQPFNFTGAFILANAARQLKDLESGQVLYRVCANEALKLQSADKMAEAYLGLNELLMANKKYDEAINVCKEVLELKDEGDRFRLLKVQVLMQMIRGKAKQGKMDEAMKLVDNLVKALPNSWLPLELKGQVEYEAGKYDDAAKTWEDVLERVQKDENSDKNKEAKAEFEEEIRKMHFRLSTVYTNLNQIDKASAHLKILEDILERVQKDENPDKNKEAGAEEIRSMHLQLSAIYTDLNQIDKAAGHLKILLDKNPDDPSVNNDLGYIWADHDMNLDDAEKMIRKALDEDRKRRKKENPDVKPEDDKDNAAYLDSLGWVLFKKKKFQEAKAPLLQAVKEKDGKHVEIYDHLGEVHMALGEKAEAVAVWKEALKLKTEEKREKDIKAKVEKKLKEATGEKK
jgi:tetratricopeptide (TPR) repeat protein